MSMYGIFMNDRFAVIAADTRKTTEENGKTVLLQDDYKKLYLFNGLAVAFGGSTAVMQIILNILQGMPSEQRTIHAINNIVQSIIKPNRDKLAKMLTGCPKDYMLEILAIQYRADIQKNVMYYITSLNDFEFEENISAEDTPQSGTYSWGGYEPEKYSKSFVEYCEKHTLENVTEAFLHNFQINVNERVGGYMDIIAFDKGQLVEYDRFKLQDTYLHNTNKTIEEGHAVFGGHVRGGSIESDTNVNVTTDITVGRKIILQDKDENTTGFDIAAILSVDTGVFQISARNNRIIELRTDGNINLHGNNCTINNRDILAELDAIKEKLGN